MSKKKIFDLVALVASIVTIIQGFPIEGRIQVASLVLLVVMCGLIIGELSSTRVHDFRIAPKFAVALIIFTTGIIGICGEGDAIKNAILGGVFICALTFGVDLLLRRLYKMTQALDQGTYISLYVAGLYVGAGNSMALGSLFGGMACLYYLPQVIFRRFTLLSRVPIVPFIVIAALFIRLPYYDKFHEKVITCYDEFTAHWRNSGQKPKIQAVLSLIADTNTPSLTPVGKLIATYSNKSPRLVYSSWYSHGGEDEEYVVVDSETGYRFIVKPIYKVSSIEIPSATDLPKSNSLYLGR